MTAFLPHFCQLLPERQVMYLQIFILRASQREFAGSWFSEDVGFAFLGMVVPGLFRIAGFRR